MMMMMNMMMKKNRPGDLSDAPSMVPSDQPSSVPSIQPSSGTSLVPTIEVEPMSRQRRILLEGLSDRKGIELGTQRYMEEENNRHRRLSETDEAGEIRWLDADPLFVKITPPNRLSPTMAPFEVPATPTVSTAAPTATPVGVSPTIASDAPSDVPSDLPSLAPSDIGTFIPTIVLQDPVGRRRLSELATEDGRGLADPLFVKLTPPNQLSSTTAPTQEPVSQFSDSPSDVPSGSPTFVANDATSALPTFEVPSSESETDPLFVKFGPPVPTQAPTVALPLSSVPSDFPSDAPSFVPVLTSSEPPVAVLTVKSFTLRSRQTEEMDTGTVSEFEMACGNEFFPTYLPLIFKASYEGLQCSVHSQAVVRSTDSRSLPEESFVEVTTGSVAIVMKVSAKIIQPPPGDFNAIVAKTLETYSTEFQQLLSDRTSYFESAESVEPQTFPVAQQGRETTSEDDQHGTMVVIVAVCCVLLTVSLVAGILAAKGRKSSGTSPEAMATLVDDGVAVEVFSTGTHRKSLDVEVRESHSSISSSATSPIPATHEKIFTLGFPEHVLLNVPRRVDEASMPRSQLRANRMHSFSTGVCSNESDLFDRSYNKGMGSSEEEESVNGIGLVQSSTTGSRVSEDFDDFVDHIQSMHSPPTLRGEGQNRFAWTRKIFGARAGAPDACASVPDVPNVHLFDFDEAPAVVNRR